MEMTDAFASTCAVTIPVLGLAAALELRGMRRDYKKFSRMISGAASELGKFRKKHDKLRSEFDRVAEEVVEAADLRQQLHQVEQGLDESERTMRSSEKLQVGFYFCVATLWTLTLLVAVPAEFACLLFLGGGEVPGSANLAATVVMAQMLLLVLLPGQIAYSELMKLLGPEIFKGAKGSAPEDLPQG